MCGHIDLQARSIDEAQAADLRIRLVPFVEEWDSPQMDVYDSYGTVKANHWCARSYPSRFEGNASSPLAFADADLAIRLKQRES